MFEWYEDEVKALEARTFGTENKGPFSTPDTSGSIVFYGSSSVRLWNTLPEDIGPLTGEPPRPIVNLGFGGSTLAGCVHYFDRLPGRVARERGPLRSLIFYAGENDLGDGNSAAAVVESFIWLHAMVRDRLGETPFAFLSIKPSPARAEVMGNIRTVNAKVRELIAERPQSQFIDIYSEMVKPDGSPRRELWSEDGIHMNSAGYVVWTQVLTRYQESLFR